MIYSSLFFIFLYHEWKEKIYLAIRQRSFTEFNVLLISSCLHAVLIVSVRSQMFELCHLPGRH